MTDGRAFYAGSGNDLGIFHNGTNTYLQNLTGHLIIEQFADDKDIVFNSDDGSGGLTEYLKIDGGAGYTIATKDINVVDSVGVTFGTGIDAFIKHTGANLSFFNDIGNISIVNRQDDGNIIFESDNGSGGTTEYLRLDGGDARTIASREIRTLDGVAFKAGSGGELGIFHDGTSSIIENTTGHLDIKNLSNDADIRFKNDDGSGGDTTYFFLDGSHTRTTFAKDIKLEDNVKILGGTGED
jgi:hypothetical protein